MLGASLRAVLDSTLISMAGLLSAGEQAMRLETGLDTGARAWSRSCTSQQPELDFATTSCLSLERETTPENFEGCACAWFFFCSILWNLLCLVLLDIWSWFRPQVPRN